MAQWCAVAVAVAAVVWAWALVPRGQRNGQVSLRRAFLAAPSFGSISMHDTASACRSSSSGRGIPLRSVIRGCQKPLSGLHLSLA